MGENNLRTRQSRLFEKCSHKKSLQEENIFKKKNLSLYIFIIMTVTYCRVGEVDFSLSFLKKFSSCKDVFLFFVLVNIFPVYLLSWLKSIVNICTYTYFLSQNRMTVD